MNRSKLGIAVIVLLLLVPALGYWAYWSQSDERRVNALLDQMYE